MLFFILGLVWTTIVFGTLKYILTYKKEHIDNITLYVSIYLITYKVIELFINIILKKYHKIPIDYSAIMYFLLSVTVIFKINKLNNFVYFGSFLAGLGYLLTFTFNGKMIYNHTLYLLLAALFNHSVLFFVSTLLLIKQKFELKNYKFVLFCTFLVGVYATILLQFIDFSMDTFLLIDLLTGKIFGIPSISNKFLFLLINYLFISVIYFGLYYIFIKINHLIFDIFNKNDVIMNEEALI